MMSSGNDIPSLVAETMESHQLTRHQPLVVAVSGGPDSMVLLHILAVSLQFRVITAHVNYGKRGGASDADQGLVASWCSRHDIPVKIYDARNHPKITGDTGNFQDHARRVRQEFLKSVMQDNNAGGIALAHHRDDQAETVLQKILRGSAPENWTGMAVYDPPWIRPLLTVTRTVLEKFAEQNGVPYRTDHTNLESGYARNMLRNDVFPLLENHLPGWRDNLEHIAEFGKLHSGMLDYLVSGVTVHSGPATADTLQRSRWIALPESLRAAVARHWIRRQTGFAGWSRGIIRRLEDLAHLSTGGEIPVSEHHTIIRDRDFFVISSHRVTQDDQPVSGNSDDAARGSGEATIRLAALSDKPERYGGLELSQSRYRPESGGEILQLNLNALPDTIQLRPWQDGDRMRPLGMEGSQLVSDHLTNRKITTYQKRETLVLVSFDGMVHAVIFPHPKKSGEIGSIAEHARCHSKGEPVLAINKPDNST